MPALLRHPDSKGGEGLALDVEADRAGAGQLMLRFMVTGEVGRLSVPERAAPVRRDGLWRSTCFEAFVQTAGGGYLEINLASSTEWATYHFEGYRAGMEVAEGAMVTRIGSGVTGAGLELQAELDFGGEAVPPRGPWKLGLSAVLEDSEGLSYWALAHPGGKPDFHHPDSFVLELPEPP